MDIMWMGWGGGVIYLQNDIFAIEEADYIFKPYV